MYSVTEEERFLQHETTATSGGVWHGLRLCHRTALSSFIARKSLANIAAFLTTAESEIDLQRKKMFCTISCTSV